MLQGGLYNETVALLKAEHFKVFIAWKKGKTTNDTTEQGNDTTDKAAEEEELLKEQESCDNEGFVIEAAVVEQKDDMGRLLIRNC